MADNQNNAVTGTVTYDSNVWQATWKASADFTVTAQSNPFKFTMSSNVSDSNGETLGEDYIATYTIGTNSDLGAPGYPNPYPADNDTGVSIYNTSVIGIGFNIPLDPTTVTAANLSVTTSPVTDPVQTIGGIGTVTYNPYANGIEITPSGILLADTQYTITVSTNVKSSTGVPLAAAYNTIFTTASTSSQAAPSIVWSDLKQTALKLNERGNE